ncbi:helix-turn-helix transcriptional regulator [Flavobacterium sp.]|uniref:helix-turn-helix domain-containing protein n=1 Tax=Flavobacterium sp. TaxID=239 RepID=UPI00286F1703|nr:helix-turn-helix transcriptional regulator [Flavobacterium sp.]
MVTLILKSIQLARIENNYSQEFIATKLNFSQSYYAKIEGGKAKLSAELLFQLLEILELDCVDFFKQIKKKKKKNDVTN